MHILTAVDMAHPSVFVSWSCSQLCPDIQVSAPDRACQGFRQNIFLTDLYQFLHAIAPDMTSTALYMLCISLLG